MVTHYDSFTGFNLNGEGQDEGDTQGKDVGREGIYIGGGRREFRKSHNSQGGTTCTKHRVTCCMFIAYRYYFAVKKH